MNVLIDIGHPGHVHYFKHTIKYLQDNNHKVMIIARDRPVIIELLKKMKLPYYNRGKGKNSKIGKLLYMLKADLKILKIARKFKPDLFLSFSTPYAAQVSSLLGKPHIALTDTEHEDNVLSKFTYPFTESIITANSYLNDLGDKQIRFNSVVEGLYLHKEYFIPNPDVRKDLNLKESEEYILIRFVSWTAHHDVGHSGLDNKTKRDIINLLKSKYKIFISSESELPEEFAKYKINISAEKMHDVLAHATLFIGESATMASEGALLGTNAVYINSLPLMGYLKLEQDAGLLKHFNSSDGVVAYIKELIRDSNLKSSAKTKSDKMQSDFINPTKFLTWFIENYPESNTIMKKNPDYQDNFK